MRPFRRVKMLNADEYRVLKVSIRNCTTSRAVFRCLGDRGGFQRLQVRTRLRQRRVFSGCATSHPQKRNRPQVGRLAAPRSNAASSGSTRHPLAPKRGPAKWRKLNKRAMRRLEEDLETRPWLPTAKEGRSSSRSVGSR